VLNPRQFFDQIVVPCVKDWEEDPLNIRKAVIAISQTLRIMSSSTSTLALGGRVNDVGIMRLMLRPVIPLGVRRQIHILPH
jgi:hypothetical protein